ncbi:transcriptional regulator, XRE family with cupin sensor [Ketogulonicigenium robustum]|uniref:Transcriptional regulator, XRE family with cupin sensor n=1 Tax=Ketogulonicigenium robustum TaxID=92947 RepID=A0A1W6NY54_9RHOB|nr:transcriptional regulator, XRE family with cupin sensor [Ketogulonicigenium robustum]
MQNKAADGQPVADNAAPDEAPHIVNPQQVHDGPVYGSRIRDLRKKNGLTLQQMSDRAGLSVGFLSQLERDKAVPSLGSLARLAQVLQVDVDHFISTPRPTDGLSRAAGREVFGTGPGRARYERVTTVMPGSNLSGVLIHMPPGCRLETTSHPGEEFILVLEGEIEMTLGHEVMRLVKDDALHFMGDVPHSSHTVGGKDARLLWAGTAPNIFPKISSGPFDQ